MGIAACGGSGSSQSGQGAGDRQWITYAYSTAPDSLDPQFGYTTYSDEVLWTTYTGLLTYAHRGGEAGTRLIPGLATKLPAISDGGRTYTLTLRKGLKFSNGRPVKASDFVWTVQRAIKMPWGGSGAFITSVIAGAQPYAKGRAKRISGLSADDRTGRIVIHLDHAYGAFPSVLALTGLGIVPSGTPVHNEAVAPPPGAGPYKIQHVVANQSFDLVKNPYWSERRVPGVPAAHVNIHAKINPNVTSNVYSVISNAADVLDWADQIPGTLLGQIHARAAGRFHREVRPATYYIFFNSKRKPFSSQLARQAVVTGLNEGAMNRIAAGIMRPGCFYIPPEVVGHGTGKCPYGPAGNNGDLAAARALVQRSGMAGQPVTVWSESRSPRQQWMTYYTQYLNQLGFKATLRLISDATYFATVGNLKLNAQTGFGDWNPDFPNPIDFYAILNGDSITPTNNENFGQVDDPYIQSRLGQLGTVPSSRLSTARQGWETLDAYVARKAYLDVFGYPTFPGLVSDRIDQSKALFHPVYGWDLTSLETK